MNAFLETVQKRRSIRAFSDRPVDPSKIKKILKIATLTPSSGGFQGYKIFSVSDKKKKEQLVKAAHKQKYVNSPLVLVFCFTFFIASTSKSYESRRICD